MSAHDIDNSWEHLYPDFRAKLRKVLEEAPGGPWKLTEGYRSQERQTWLYAAGRTRPGPIVTWMRKPLNHGAGLAADVVPAAGYNAPRGTWEELRRIYTHHGLENPAWKKGDLGHIQWPSSDQQTHQEAEDWCEAGFPAIAQHETVPIIIRGNEIGLTGEIRDGTTWAPLRSLAQALNLTIFEVDADSALVGPTVPRQGVQVPLRIDGGKGFSPVRQVCDIIGLAVQRTERGVEIA